MKRDWHYYSKNFFRTERLRMAQSRSTFTSFIHTACDPNNPDHQYQSQNALTSASGVRGSFSFFLPKVSGFLKMLFKKLLFAEYPLSETKDFRGSYYWAIDPATGLRVLMVSVWCYLPCKRRDSNELGVLSQSSIWRPYPSRFPRTEENNAIAYSSRSTLNIDTTNLSASNGFIFCKVLNYTYFPKPPSKVNSLIEGINFYTCLTHARIKHLPLLTSRCVLV